MSLILRPYAAACSLYAEHMCLQCDPSILSHCQQPQTSSCVIWRVICGLQLTNEQREEMRWYRHQAVMLESKLRASTHQKLLLKLQTTVRQINVGFIRNVSGRVTSLKYQTQSAIFRVLWIMSISCLRFAIFYRMKLHLSCYSKQCYYGSSIAIVHTFVFIMFYCLSCLSLSFFTHACFLLVFSSFFRAVLFINLVWSWMQDGTYQDC